MSDFIFRILCMALYDDLYSYKGFSLSSDDSEMLETVLTEEFKKNPYHYAEILRASDGYLSDLEERFRFHS